MTVSLSVLAAVAALAYLVIELYRRTFMDYGDDIPVRFSIPFVNAPRADKIRTMHQEILKQMNEGRGVVGRGILPWKPWRSTVVVGHPAVLREIFVGKDWEAFDRPIWNQDPSMTYHAGGMLLMPNGKNWREMRELLGKTFSTTSIRSYVSILREELDTLVTLMEKESAAKPDGFDVQDFYNRFTFDTISRLSFGAALGVQHDRKSGQLAAWDNLTTLSSLWAIMTMVSADYLVPGFVKKEFFKNYKIIREIVTSNLARVRSGKKTEAKVSILDDMMSGKLPEFIQNDEEALIKQLVTLLFAGHDTTTTLLSFSTYHLARNPKWRSLVRAEVTSTFPVPDEPLTLEKLETLPHLTAVLKETLRMYPSAPFGTGRTVTKDVRVAFPHHDGSQKFVQFRKGDSVLVNVYVAQNTAEFWNKPVDVWDPSRWLDDANGGAVSPYAYAPFGNGARKCMGERLALGEGRLTLATILRRFDIEPAIDPKDKFKLLQHFTGTIKAANGVGIRLVPLKV